MSSPSKSPPGLARTLGLFELLVIGVIMVQPTAPMPPYGAISAAGHGHVVTTVLIAMFAMLLTALSYGRMARAYPVAGSAYSYVAREIHPALGFITGWSMLLDYVVNPLICVIWCAKGMLAMFPSTSYPPWAIFFAALFTWLNLRGIRSTARTNQVLAGVMGLVVVWMLAATSFKLNAMPAYAPGFWTQPFYDPALFSWGAVSNGASVAVLTYIGFDGISTLSEEVKNPRRNILLGIVGTCLIIGVLSAVEVYAAQLLWPTAQAFPDNDTAYLYVAGRAGGAALFQTMSWTLILASIGSAGGGVLAGARLLYGMGRDGVLPRSFFGYLHPERRIPSRNVLLIGGLCLAGAFLISYQVGAELLNFGALIGFMGVNLSTLLHYWVRGRDRGWSFLVLPVLGFVVCLYLWLSLSVIAKVAGLAWLVLGLVYGAWKTRGFQREMVRFEEVADD